MKGKRKHPNSLPFQKITTNKLKVLSYKTVINIVAILTIKDKFLNILENLRNKTQKNLVQTLKKNIVIIKIDKTERT